MQVHVVAAVVDVVAIVVAVVVESVLVVISVMVVHQVRKQDVIAIVQVHAMVGA